MHMKKHIIIAGIMSAALLAGGCGKFVRDELISMQNEIDQLYGTVEKMNRDLTTLQTLVSEMQNGGYITDVAEFTDEDGRGGYLFTFNGSREPVKVYHGQDGQDGQDADSPEITVRQDEETGRWYWFMGEDWLYTPDGEKVLVDGRDGKSPTLKIEDGFWFLSWDGGVEWEKTEWPARGQDAYEILSKVEVFDDRIELTLSADESLLVLPRYLPVDMELVLDGQSLDGDVLIAPGEKLAIRYTLTGTGVKKALLAAGTDGRFKTALLQESLEEGVVTGTVEVTCPATFPEGGYIYVTVNDGSGRSQVRVVRFVERSLKLLVGEETYSAAAEGETGKVVSFESNFEVEPVCVFPEGVEPWLTVKTEVVENIVALTYDVLPNAGTEGREACIRIVPKDHPGFEMFRITVTQAGTPAPDTTGTGGGE